MEVNKVQYDPRRFKISIKVKNPNKYTRNQCSGNECPQPLTVNAFPVTNAPVTKVQETNALQPKKLIKGSRKLDKKPSFSECVFIANRLFWLWRTQQAASLLLLLETVTTKEFRIRILQSIIYQYYKLKLQCTVYSAALHGCTTLHCFLSFQVSLQCDSHFSHD